LAETIFGARRPTSGNIVVHGEVRKIKSPRQAIDLGMALVTEDRKRTGLVLKMLVKDNVGLATMKGPLINLTAQDNQVKSMIDELSILPDGCANMPVWQLSGGNQQKTVLAKWMLTNPTILILDEPTRGVDMATRVDIYKMIDALARSGLSVLLVSSDLTEAIGATDRVLVMRDGQLSGELDSASTTEDEVLSYSIGRRQ
jgi:ABC-type sugar transport system ATPase subunit